MALTSLLVCADAKAVQVLTRVLLEMGIRAEHCGDPSVATPRLEARRFDAILVDCKDERAAMQLIAAAHKAPINKTTLVVAMVDGHNNVHDIFAQGANFIMYKPISTERAASAMRAAKSLMRRERRNNQRVPLHAPASIAYANTEDAPAILVDLSEEGVAVQSQRRVPAGCKVYFQFTLPGHAATIRLSGEVMWQDASGRVGIRFADVPQASRRVLNEWLQANFSRVAESQTPRLEQPDTRPHAKPAAGLGLLSVSAADRRVKSRLACRLGADVFRVGSGVPYRCSLSDIGTGGCYVETTEPFPVGTTLDIVVRTQDVKLRVRGSVQTMHPGFGMGVRFSLNNANERAQVEQLIACQGSEPGIPLEPWTR
jgi:DNA-binding NarL/FixJ family response regulator